jgi:hypothetical protein
MAENTQKNFVEEHLDDDKPPGVKEFKGATLQIDAPSTQNQNGEEPGVGYAGPGQNFNRNRPGSVMGRQSVRSTSSRTSMRPGVIRTDGMSDQFFSYKVKMCILLNNFLFIWSTTIGLTKILICSHTLNGTDS